MLRALVTKRILSSHHPDIQFTSEEEKEKKLPFLDVVVERKDLMFETSIFRKPTFTKSLTKWTSLVPRHYKVPAVSSMVYRNIRICSLFEIMYNEFNYIRDVTLRNGYPSNFVECQIRHTLNRYFQPKDCLEGACPFPTQFLSQISVRFRYEENTEITWNLFVMNFSLQSSLLLRNIHT
jgi:hypothetical protein